MPERLSGPPEGRDPLEHLGPASDHLAQPFAPVRAGERAADDRAQLAFDHVGHLAVQAVHVLEVPKHGAQAHVGAGGHLLGAGGDLAGLHDLQHGRHDPRAVVLAAPAAPVDDGVGRVGGWGGRVHLPLLTHGGGRCRAPRPRRAS